MKPITILRRARKLLSDPKKWTKGDYAFDRHGYLTFPTSKEAVCWCAEGACNKFAGDYETARLAINLLNDAVPAKANVHFACNYNDKLKSHRNLMQWFDRAIKLAEKNP